MQLHFQCRGTTPNAPYPLFLQFTTVLSPDGSKLTRPAFLLAKSPVEWRETLEILEVPSGELLTTLDSETKFNYVKFSGDGLLVLTTFVKNEETESVLPVTIWAATTGQLLQKLTAEPKCGKGLPSEPCLAPSRK